ncbi:Adherens junction-associated protein 1 [Plecturocebus cupreus]
MDSPVSSRRCVWQAPSPAVPGAAPRSLEPARCFSGLMNKPHEELFLEEKSSLVMVRAGARGPGAQSPAWRALTGLLSFPPRSSMSIRWPGRPLGSHAWILIAMFQLAVDLPACEALGPGPEFWLLPRSPPRPPRLWSFRSGQPARVPAPVWSPRPPRVERTHGQMQVSRARRAHRPRDQAAALVPKAGLAKPPAAAKSNPSLASSSSSSSSAVAGGTPEQQALLRRGKRHLQGDSLSSFDSRGSRPTTETEFIAWGPTGDEEGLESNTLPAIYGPTTVSILQTRKTTVAATMATTTATPMTLQTKGFTESLDPRRRIPGGLSTTEPSTSPSNSGEATQPPRILGEASGMAVSLLVWVCLGLRAGGVTQGRCLPVPGVTSRAEAPRRYKHDVSTRLHVRVDG